MKNNEYILNCLAEKQVSLIGFADVGILDQSVTRGMPYAVCFAIALRAFPSMGETPELAYCAEYKNVNARLKEIGLYLEEKIKQKGFAAHALIRDDKLSRYNMPLPLKTLATRAGLGWIGKSATLITEAYGNAVRLGGVLTDMPLETGTPIEQSYCGACTACADACPAGAIRGKEWNVHTKRDELVDPLLCDEMHKKRGAPFGVNGGACGICIGACPYSQKYIKK